jgi:integrase
MTRLRGRWPWLVVLVVAVAALVTSVGWTAGQTRRWSPAGRMPVLSGRGPVHNLDQAADPGWVFATRNGTPVHPRNDYRSFREIIRQAGLRTIRLHDLRHTAASVLLAQGVPARVVMEILGHSQISVTLNTYAHVAPDIARNAADRIEGALWDEA